MRELERQVLLTVLDRKWREHLYEMDYLREGIGLRAMAQRDPLVEYQREGGQMFNAMMEAFMEEVVGYLFNLEVQVEDEPAVQVQTGSDGQALDVDQLLAGANQARPRVEAKGLGAQKRATNLNYSAPDEQGDAEKVSAVAETKDAFLGTGRNRPCPCGSGRKYKNCHGKA